MTADTRRRTPHLSRRPALLRAAIVGLVMACLLALAGPGHAGPSIRSGKSHGPQAVPLYQGAYGQVCGVTGRMWIKEFGRSGVNRFRARYFLRGAYDPGYRFFPAHGRTPWIRTAPFPDDGRSFLWINTLPPNLLRYYAGKEYSLHVKLVAERPSWWQHDIVKRGNMGRFACEHDPGGIDFNT